MKKNDLCIIKENRYMFLSKTENKKYMTAYILDKEKNIYTLPIFFDKYIKAEKDYFLRSLRARSA